MRITGRGKAFVVVAAMLTTFTVLPAMSAAAAEPLADGSYDVPVAAAVHTVVVAAGLPAVDAPADVVFRFSFDAETGRVLDRFDVTAHGVAYDVHVQDDGAVAVAIDREATVLAQRAMARTAAPSAATPGPRAAAPAAAAAPQMALVADEAVPHPEPAPQSDPTADAADAVDAEMHGALVSLVASCAPTGTAARTAGLPSHGELVSAATRGASVELRMGEETVVVDLSSMAGAQELCAVTAAIVAAATAPTLPGSAPEGELTEPVDSSEVTSSDDDGAAEPSDGTEHGDGLDDTLDGLDVAGTSDRVTSGAGKGNGGAAGRSKNG